METTSMNIRTSVSDKKQAEYIFNQLGFNMTTAVNMFLKAVIRERAIPFELKLDDEPNKETVSAIEEGRKIISDPATKNTIRLKI